MAVLRLDQITSNYLYPDDKELFPRLDPYFAKNLEKIFILSLFLLALFGILLFDVRISEGGDDSAYLLEAMKFHQGKSFPSFHGSSYSVMLGWLIGLFGFHLIFFKVLSLIFLLVHQVFLYFTFRKLMSPFILSIVLLIVSVNSGIIYYGSQTYTETFYMMLQSIFFYLLLKDTTNDPDNFRIILTDWRKYLGLGFLIFLLSITRNVGLVALLAMILYLLFEKKYWSLLFYSTSFLIFKLAYNFYRIAFWNLRESEIHGQLSVLLSKDPFNPTLGNISVFGMFERIYDNMNIYFSNIFLREIGLKAYSNIEISFVLTWLICAIIFAGIIYAYIVNARYLRLVFLYLILALGITFISLSQMWSQARLILIFIPLILLSMSWTLAKLGQVKKLAIMKTITVLLLATIFVSSGFRTINKTLEHQIILKKNRSGDKLNGYTPDLKNYLQLSEWTSANIPEDLMVGARKASLSFIYGHGREFFSIYKIPYASTVNLLDSVATINKTVVFIKDSDLGNKHIDQLRPLKKQMIAIIAFSKSVYSMYIFDNRNFADSLIQFLNVPAMFGVDQFRETMGKDIQKSTTTYLPDKLLDKLKRNNVHYIIDASLRVNTQEKSQRKIGTVKRYMMAVSHKYPEAFTLVKQMGADSDEPAWLFRINYEKCK
jgi:hypothetical protein